MVAPLIGASEHNLVVGIAGLVFASLVWLPLTRRRSPHALTPTPQPLPPVPPPHRQGVTSGGRAPRMGLFYQNGRYVPGAGSVSGAGSGELGLEGVGEGAVTELIAGFEQLGWPDAGA
jgi:hypothetical protein